MTKAGDSVLVTPGSGATMSTHVVDSKEHEVFMVADGAGTLLADAGGTYGFDTALCTQETQTGGRDNERLYVFNNDASLIVEILSVQGCFTRSDEAPAGQMIRSRLYRISAFTWTGGTTVTPIKLDTTSGALDADITMGYHTGVSTPTFTISGAAIGHASFCNVLDGKAFRGRAPLWSPMMPPIVLRQGQGIGVEDVSSNVDAAAGIHYSAVLRVR